MVSWQIHSPLIKGVFIHFEPTILHDVTTAMLNNERPPVKDLTPMQRNSHTLVYHDCSFRQNSFKD